MNQQIFVPVTDELIYNHPENIEGPLVPYYAGMECQHWLSIEINPDESNEVIKKTHKKSKSSASRAHLKLV